jgi:hypothetical protein
MPDGSILFLLFIYQKLSLKNHIYFYFLFFGGLTSGIDVHVSTTSYVQPTQPLQMGPISQLKCQNTFRWVSVQFVTPRPKIGRFLKNYQNRYWPVIFVPNVVVSCNLLSKNVMQLEISDFKKGRARRRATDLGGKIGRSTHCLIAIWRSE